MHRVPRLAIRVKVLMFLKKIPMNSFELSQKIGCSLNDLEEQLLYLEKEGRIEKIHSEKFNEDFWRIKK